MGRRVTLRYLDDTDERTPAREVVGVLVAADPTVLTVRRRDGSVVPVARAAVVAGRVVPDAPHRRPRATTEITPDDLERVAAAGWPALETDRLGSWLLRAAEGFTGRANSVLAVGDPGIPLDDALRRVREWYAARGLPARAQVVVGGPQDEALRARGWAVPGDPTTTGVLVQTAGILPVLARLPYGPGTPEVRVDDRPDDAWLAVYRTGTTPPPAGRLLRRHPRAGYASVDDGARLAVGRAAVDGDWVGLSAVEVVPEARGRGLARAVVRALLIWARDQGARFIYLQVGEDNEPALGLYASMGFTTHHRYRYLTSQEAAEA